MSTDPYRADTPDLLAAPGGLEQVYRAYITHPSLAGPLALEKVAGTVAWDEDRAPRVDANLTARVPDTAGEIAALDPRTGARLVIDAGYRRPGGAEDVKPWVDLSCRVAGVLRPADTVRITGAGDESLVIDASPTAALSVTATNDAEAIVSLIAGAMSPAPIIDVRALGSSSVALADITDRWSTIRDRADRSKLAVYDAGLRRWVIEARPTSPASVDHILSTGPGGTVEEADLTVTRDGWANFVLFVYRWRDAAGVDQQVTSTAYVSSGPFAITGPSGRVIYREERDTPTTQAEANATTAAVLERMVTRGRRLTVKAISALWLRPGATVGVLLPVAPQEKHLVSRVAFDLAAGSMTVETRDPVITAYSKGTTTNPPAGPGLPTPPPLADPLPTAAALRQSTWEASAVASYRGDGSKRSDGTLYQGYQDPTNGNQSSLAIFRSANSYGSDRNLTVAAALAGVPTSAVRKVEAYVAAQAWAYVNPVGGILRVAGAGNATIPTAFIASDGGLDVPAFLAGDARWVDVTSRVDLAQLVAGNVALAFGPGNGQDLRYAGQLYPLPLVRITYVK